MGDADRLRGGLARPATERGPLVRRGRAATIPLSAAAFVAVAVLVPMSLQGSGGTAGPDLIIPPHRIVHSPPDPLTINACPARLGHEFAAALPSRIATIRICDLPATHGGSGTRSPLDALIIQLSGLVADLESVPAADPARCAESKTPITSAVMVVTDRSGDETLVPVEGCYDIGVSGRRIDVADMHEVVLEHLATQRRTMPGRWSGGSQAASCAAIPTAALFDPGTELVIAASICPESGADQFLMGADLGLIKSAWVSAARVRGPATPCLDEGNPARLMVTTDFGDSITFDFDGCGNNAQTAAFDSRPWNLPLDDRTLAQLGLS